jgi:hypothetical protein
MKTRKQMMELLQTKWKFDFVKTAEEFYGGTPSSVGQGIWISAENGYEHKGKAIFNYFSMDETRYNLGVLKEFDEWLDKNGWYPEWEDAGTVMLYNNNNV